MHLPWEEIEKLTKYLEDKGLAEVSGQNFLPQILLPSSSQKTSSEAEIKKSNLPEITSPMVGTFYGSPTPGAEPFIKVGSKIKPGDVLCIIEAMKIMNELPSEISGTVKEILVKDGQTVEYGQVVIRVEP